MVKSNPVVDTLCQLLQAHRNSEILTVRQLLELSGLTEFPSDSATGKRILWAVKGNTSSPVALTDDIERLAASGELLEYLLRSTVSAENQAVPMTDLKKPLQAKLKPVFESAVLKAISEHTLPETVGCLHIKGKPHLFLQESLNGNGQSLTSADFAQHFLAKFASLNETNGSRNFVSLIDLRREMSVNRDVFDRGIRKLRESGKLTLSATEGRHGISDEERQAGIVEEGQLLLFVSLR